VCPQCGSSADVRTVRELFDTMNGAREQAFQRMNQFGQNQYGQYQSGQNQYGQNQYGQPGAAPGQWPANSAPGQYQGPAGSPADDGYDHYNVEGSDRQLRKNRGWNQNQRGRDLDFDGDSIVDDIGGAVLGAALGFVGRRMKKAFEERVIPAVQARAAQAQQQFEQSKAEQDAIAARYPELRGCTKDQVVFVDGGLRTVPISEIKMPVTLAEADAIVARLR